MIQFNWCIDSLPVYIAKDGKTNVVSEVNWHCDAVEDNAYFDSLRGTIVLELDQTSFVAYDQLTQDIVWEWVYAKINKEAIEKNLRLTIDAQKVSKPVTLSLPWTQI